MTATTEVDEEMEARTATGAARGTDLRLAVGTGAGMVLGPDKRTLRLAADERALPTRRRLATSLSNGHRPPTARLLLKKLK